MHLCIGVLERTLKRSWLRARVLPLLFCVLRTCIMTADVVYALLAC